MPKLLIIISLFFFAMACKSPIQNLSPNKISYKEEMRLLIQKLSKDTKTRKADFLIVAQNGLELLKSDGEDTPNQNYLAAIDAIAVDNMYYGTEGIEKLNKETEIAYNQKYLSLAPKKPILAIDYCISASAILNSFTKNAITNNKVFIAYAKPLDIVPQNSAGVYLENKNNILKLDDAKNFVLLQTNDNYTSKTLAESLANTNYDLVIIDPFLKNELLNTPDIKALKTKKNGGKRLVMAILNIAEADSRNYYWEKEWTGTLPDFTAKQTATLGQYKTKYWQPQWQSILYGASNSLATQLIANGYDGLYIVNNEAFEWFE
jgi:cysteinyl-tRNA synthetase, unknown class